MDQNRTSTEKTGTGFIVALVMWQGLNMEYLIAWEVPPQVKCWGKEGQTLPGIGEDGIGHIYTEMCNLEKSNVKLVERWCLVRAGEGLHGKQTVMFVKPLSAHPSVTLCPENPDLLIERFTHPCSFSSVLSGRGLLCNLYIFLPMQPCVFPFL